MSEPTRPADPPNGMRLLGQRPRYQEGPPEGAGHVRLPPPGAGKPEVPIGDAPTRPLLDHRDHRHGRSTLSHQEPGRLPRKARRIAGSSSGHTATGRGFMM